MKKLIILLPIIFFQCGNGRAFTVHTSTGSGWGEKLTRISCDSVQMISDTNAIIWVDGRKINIIAEVIHISN